MIAVLNRDRLTHFRLFKSEHLGASMRSSVKILILLAFVGSPTAAASAQTVSATTQGTSSQNDDYPGCIDRFAVVHDISPFFGLNDFNGSTQTVEALGYARSECIGDSDTRWRLEANIAHVDQKKYSADSALLGAGIELHPSTKAPDLVIVPVVRLGYERIPSGNDNLVFGGAVTAQNTWTLNFITRDVATTTTDAPGTQFITAGRVEYTNRNAVNARIPVQGSMKNQLNFFGMLGLDSPFEGGRWRWRSTASYQSIDGGTVNGYASFSFAVRHLDERFESYRWNYQIIGNYGDHGYRGILLNVSYRFTQSRETRSSYHF